MAEPLSGVWLQWFTLEAMYAESDASQYPALPPYTYGSIRTLS